MTCDRVQIIHQGQLVYADNINNLNQRMQSNSLILGLQRAPVESELAALDNIEHVEKLPNNRFRLSHAVEKSPAENIAQIAAEQNWGLFELTPEQKTLEQVFVELTSGDVIANEVTADEDAGEAA